MYYQLYVTMSNLGTKIQPEFLRVFKIKAGAQPAKFLFFFYQVGLFVQKIIRSRLGPWT